MVTVKFTKDAIVDERTYHKDDVAELRDDAAAQLIKFGWAAEASAKKKTTKKEAKADPKTVAEE